MWTKHVTLTISLLLTIPVAQAQVDLVPSNSDPVHASSFMARTFLEASDNPDQAFEVSSANLRAFMRDPNHAPIAIIDLRQDIQYNEGYIRDSIRWPMDDNSQWGIIAQWRAGREFPVLSHPDVVNARYVVFYCQQGASRSPAMSMAYYENVIAPNAGNHQSVVLLSKGFQEFEKDPANAALISRRSTIKKINIHPDDDAEISSGEEGHDAFSSDEEIERSPKAPVRNTGFKPKKTKAATKPPGKKFALEFGPKFEMISKRFKA